MGNQDVGRAAPFKLLGLQALLGCGRAPRSLPPSLCWAFLEGHQSLEQGPTLVPHDLIVANYFCKRPCFQVTAQPGGPGGREF